jgi:hypothetical protein
VRNHPDHPRLNLRGRGWGLLPRIARLGIVSTAVGASSPNRRGYHHRPFVRHPHLRIVINEQPSFPPQSFPVEQHTSSTLAIVASLAFAARRTRLPSRPGTRLHQGINRRPSHRTIAVTVVRISPHPRVSPLRPSPLGPHHLLVSLPSNRGSLLPPLRRGTLQTVAGLLRIPAVAVIDLLRYPFPL